MKKRWIKGWSISFLILLGFLFFPWLAKAQEKQENVIEIRFYYNNACASCQEEEVYTKLVKEGLEGITNSYPHEIWTYNCFKPADKKKYQEELAARGWSQEEASLPLMIIGDQKVSGEERMREQIRELFQQEVQMVSGSERIQFFSTKSCRDCERARELLEQKGGELEEYSIDDPDHLALLYQYFETYGVKEEDQQVPIAFLGNEYFPGVDGIKRVLAAGTEAALQNDETELAYEQDKTTEFSWGNTPKVVLTGLVNGFNPCSASLLLFLLSLFVVSEVSAIKVGFSYLAGRFIAYMATGLGLFSLGSNLQGDTFAVMVKWIFILLAILLGGLNLIDFIHIRRREYEKVRLQLPKALKHWNYEKIRWLQRVPLKWMVPAVFLLGFVISAGEFFCTGQLYAAVIVSMIQAKTQLLKAVILLGLYVFAMCVPHAILIGLVHKSKNIMDASALSLKQMPYYKLISTVIFLVFAVWMYYSL